MRHASAQICLTSMQCIITRVAPFIVVAGLIHAFPLFAQTDPSPPPPPGAYMLHVYANRIQLPTLVIDVNGQQVHSLVRENFDIKLDGGSVFHPTAARIEGDDPINLALLLDVSGHGKDILKTLLEDFAALVPDSLHPKDHVSVFAVDCHVIRSLDDVPADPVTLKLGIEKAFATPGLHGELHEPSCAASLHLWDAIATVANALSTKSGRRVMLVVSLGLDEGSKYSVDDVAAFAGASGIAIFGMRDREENFYRRRDPNAANVHNGGLETTMYSSYSHADLLEAMCRANGGVVLSVAHTRLPQHLQEFLSILRSRYIIEYPRPDEPKPGKHTILISVHDKSSDLVLPTGSSTPLPDPAIAGDPNTVPSAASPATFGNKRPSQPKK